jgi:cell shape-determining protein MreC
VNDYTVIIDKGARDGLSEGDSVVLELEETYVRSTVVDVSEEQSVLELPTA